MVSNPKISPIDSAPAALFGHCETTYQAMLESAKTVVDGETTLIVWEGMLVHLITGKLYFSAPLYSSITKALKRMGCIYQLKRGGGTGTSKWQLIKAPTLETFNNNLPKREFIQTKYELLQTQVSAQEKRITVLEKIFDKFFDEELKKSQEPQE